MSRITAKRRGFLEDDHLKARWFALAASVVLTTLAGCALYDASQGPSEEGDGGECSAAEVAAVWAAGSCVTRCEVALDAPVVDGSSKANACGEGEGCGWVYRSGESSQGVGVCLAPRVRDACALKNFDYFRQLEGVDEVKPCAGSRDQYHVAARPDGGFVIAGCGKREGEPGLQVLWLDEHGGIDADVEAATYFRQYPEDELPTRLLGLEALDDDRMLVLKDTPRPLGAGGTADHAYLRLVDYNGLEGSWVDVGLVGSCPNPVDKYVGFAVNGDRALVGRCVADSNGDNPKLAFREVEIDNGGIGENILRQVTEDNSVREVLQRVVAVDGAEGAFAVASHWRTNNAGAGQFRVRVVGLSETVPRYALDGMFDEPMTFGGYPVLPTAALWTEALDANPSITFAWQDGGRIKLAKKVGSVSAEAQLLDTNREVVLDLLRLGDEGGAAWALLVVSDDGQSGRRAKVYGLSEDFDENLWVAEIDGGQAGFSPHEMAASEGQLAVVGARDDGAPAVYLLDASGRGLCEAGRLRVITEQVSSAR